MNAETLKAWRGRMGYSQQEAAEALGCSLATIQSAETGRRPVAPMMALACEALEQRHKAAACAPAPDDDDSLPDEQPADHGGPAWRASVEERINAQDARLAKIYNNAAKAFEQLGQRLQMLELRAGKAAPSLSESDIGMIARRAARSVLPE